MFILREATNKAKATMMATRRAETKGEAKKAMDRWG